MSVASSETMVGPVATGAGAVLGRVEGSTQVFRGIPYAAAAEGPLRFAPPQPPEPWTGTRDCVGPVPSAPQNPSILEAALGLEGASYTEDCLRLNVFSPDLDGAAPVMVWLHGGGFEVGTASMHWYQGHPLASRGVVVVTVGYRLGALGYLHLPEGPGAGAFGLLDQTAALEWVRDNIAGFGGDPTRVTVFGESAGALSIGALLATPAAGSLFTRAILQSGATDNVRETGRTTTSARRFAEELGVGLDDLDGLRAAPLEAILAAQSVVSREHPPGAYVAHWHPTVGSDVLPEPAHAAVVAGSAAGVELMVGTTLEEMRLFPLVNPELAAVDDASVAARLEALAVALGRPGPSLAETYAPRLAGHPVVERWLAVLTDMVFRIPAIRLAEAQVAHGAPVRTYLFSERSDSFGGGLGACHALDLPFVFDTLDSPGTELLTGPLTDARRRLAARTADLWAAFARGDTSALDTWPTYDLDHRRTLWLEADRVEVVEDPMAEERHWWDGFHGGLDPALSALTGLG